MTYNQPDLINDLANFLEPYLVVIDNGSQVPIVSPHLSYEVIRVPENRYFSGGWNYAMQFINSDWVAMLNDDITGITMEMIESLVDSAEKYQYAAISPAFNSPHAHMQPQGKGLHRVSSIDWVATLIRKQAWDEVGGFNSAAFPGYGCDLDIAYRLKQHGYRLAVDDRWTIQHLGGLAAIAGGTQIVQGNVAAMNNSFQKIYGVKDWVEFTNKYLDVV